MAYGSDAQEGRHGRHVARLQPLGPHAQAGDDGGAQRRGHQRARPRGGDGARSPGSSCAGPTPRAGSPSASTRTTRSRSSSGSSTPTGSTSPRTTQRKIERLFNREDFRRVFAERDRRHRLPAPRPRALRRGGRQPRSTSTPSEAAELQGRHRLRLRRGVVRHAQRAGQARAPRCWPLNPYVSTAGVPALPQRAARRRRSPSWSGPRAPTSARCSAPTASGSTFIDDEGRVLDDTQSLLAMLTLVADQHRRRPHRAARSTPPPPPSELLADRGVEVQYTKMSHRRPHGRRHREGRRLRRRRQTAASSCPGSCPRSTARAALVKVLDLLAALLGTWFGYDAFSGERNDRRGRRRRDGPGHRPGGAGRRPARAHARTRVTAPPRPASGRSSGGSKG